MVATGTVVDTDTNNSSSSLIQDPIKELLKLAAMEVMDAEAMAATGTDINSSSSRLLMVPTLRPLKLATLRNSRSVVKVMDMEVMADTGMVDTDSNNLPRILLRNSLSNRGVLESWKLMSLTK